MSILLNYLDEEEINQIQDTFNESLLTQIEEKNTRKIIHYLLENKVYYWKDIVIYYLEVFLLDYEEFIKKFETLKNKYGILEIGENLSLIENLL